MKTIKKRHCGRNQTRRRQTGGAVLGEGAQGKTYDICSTAASNKNSYCDLLEKQDLEAIVLYTTSGKVTLKSKEDLEAFVTYINTLKNKIAKVFKPASFVSFKSLQTKLDDELYYNKHIAQVYGKQAAAKYLTIAPLTGFKSHAIMGAVVHEKDNKKQYVVFGSKCNPRFKLRPKDFLCDLLESLVVLQKHDYSHGDIKNDNIVECDDRYKFIDWGAAWKLDFGNDSGSGTRLTNSPLRWYCAGSSALLAKSMIPLRTIVGKISYLGKSRFTSQHLRIAREFDTLLAAKSDDRKHLFKLYKKSFDVFALGMTLFYSMLKDDVDYDKHIGVVEALTSLEKPLNAAEALAYVRRHL